MRCLQHLHQEGVDGRVADEFEKEQMLQTFEADGAQGGQAQQQLGKPSKKERKEKKSFRLKFFIIFIISSIFFHSLSYLPGWSGYFCFVYDSSDAYTFSLSPSTSCGFERPLASNNTISTNVAPVHHHTHR